MFLLDDILFAPVTGLLSLARELQKAAREERERAAAAVRQELTDLYRALEAGAVTEAEFDARESALLDRLDAFEADGDEPGDEPGDDGPEETDRAAAEESPPPDGL